MMSPVGGDGTRVDGRGRPALMRLLPLCPLLILYSMIPLPVVPCKRKTKWGRPAKVGPAGLELGQNFPKFFVRFY